MKELIRRIIKETIKDGKVFCDNCEWSWDLSEGGKDKYICHECGHDNDPNKRKKPFEKFIDETSGTKELLEIYLELRKEFQELEFSESDLVSPPVYTPKMLNLYHKFGNVQRAVVKQINDFGFDVTFTEFMDYVQPLMKKIDKLTPLKEKEHGNIKRRNRWDED
jgi:hypothetical protein